MPVSSPTSAPIDSPTATPAPPDEARLRESLRRCPPEAVEAACAFQHTRDFALLPVIVRGVIARFVDRVHRDRLNHPTAHELQLSTDLGLDSLTLMEIVMLAEDVFPVTISNDELRGLRTVGDVQRFIECKLRGEPVPAGGPCTCQAATTPAIPAGATAPQSS